MKDEVQKETDARRVRVARIEFLGGSPAASPGVARVFLSDGAELIGLTWAECGVGVFAAGEFKIHGVMVPGAKA